jgi:hypothetical protein
MKWPSTASAWAPPWVDYSTQLRGFQGGAPEDVDEIEVILERLDGHGDTIADTIHPQSMLNRLFD